MMPACCSRACGDPLPPRPVVCPAISSGVDPFPFRCAGSAPPLSSAVTAGSDLVLTALCSGATPDLSRPFSVRLLFPLSQDCLHCRGGLGIRIVMQKKPQLRRSQIEFRVARFRGLANVVKHRKTLQRGAPLHFMLGLLGRIELAQLEAL